MSAPTGSCGPPHQSEHWFEPIADHLGRAYLRYSFTKGTEQEVGFLAGALQLRRGDRVLDVGCGPGRHAHALACREIAVVGIDVSATFLSIARQGGGEFARGDVRALPVRAQGVDAAICLCQGGFGLLRGDDAAALEEIARVLRPGGRLAVSAFSSYFVARNPGTLTLDPATGIAHERTVVIGEDGRKAEVDLWTTCFTPRELRLMLERTGLRVDAIWSVEPGRYAARDVDLEHPELLVLATRVPAPPR